MIPSLRGLVLSFVLVSTLVAPRDALSGALQVGEVRLVPPAPQFGFLFGFAAAGADVVAVGQYGFGEVGVVHLYGRDVGGAGAWGEVKQVAASDGHVEDYFGSTISLSGDTLVVGAPRQGGTAFLQGAVYIFERDAGGPDNWGEVKRLEGSDSATHDGFGGTVALDGDTLLVGAPGHGGITIDIGAAYVFERDAGGPGNWGEVRILQASDGSEGDHFGSTVAVDGQIGVVGTGISRSAAYVFARDLGGIDNWGEEKILSDLEGFVDVAVSGDTALVGSYKLGEVGQARVYERDQGGPANWGLVKTLTPSRSGISFGTAVALRGSRALVGMWGDDDRGTQAGAAYVFERDLGGADNWGEFEWLTASDAESSERFGRSVSLGPTEVVVGGYARAYVYEEADTVCATGPHACLGSWEKGTFLVKETAPGKEKLKLKLIRGPELVQADFGAPLDGGGTPYTVCVYDEASALVAEMDVRRAGGACRGVPCWRPIKDLPPNGKGYLYVDPNTSADGIQRVKLKAAAASSVAVQGKNNVKQNQLDLPTGIAGALSGSTSVLVEVHAGGSGCFSRTFPEVTKDTGFLFKAK